MATGTGKTYTAFQIIWRLWKAGRKKRILFLADRNVLVDQTMANDFRPFGPAMTKLSTRAGTIERDDSSSDDSSATVGRIDKAYEVYLSLYQAITGPEERQKIFREFSPTFFDLIAMSVTVVVPPRTRLGGKSWNTSPRPRRSASLPHLKKLVTFPTSITSMNRSTPTP